ncbi:WXG100 family type VII secretion target, partial [Nocardia beijingensis]
PELRGRPAPPPAPPGPPAHPVAPGRPGATGAAGYPGMVPPRLRGRRTDDDEHNSPKYLRTEEHAKELLGEVKPTVPPVLGEQ